LTTFDVLGTLLGLCFRETWAFVLGAIVIVAGVRLVEVVFQSDHWEKKIMNFFCVATATVGVVCTLKAGKLSWLPLQVAL
jgi:hypothetical protein